MTVEKEPILLAIAWRNARLRAWAAHGVPVSGGWRFLQVHDQIHGAWLGLLLCCTACGNMADRHAFAKDPVRLLEVEAEELRAKCEHLQPLLRADHAEILALTELEFISGG